MTKRWGYFNSLRLDYPVWLGVLLFLLPNVREEYRRRDGFMAYPAFGIAFEAGAPNQSENLDPKKEEAPRESGEPLEGIRSAPVSGLPGT